MKYSEFDESRGMYRVYEDAKHHALNSDLPVPKLPPPDHGIGVASRHAGRPRPRAARYIGDSWRPVGVVVRSAQAEGIGAIGDTVKAHPFLFAAATLGLMYGAFRMYISEMQKWGERY